MHVDDQTFRDLEIFAATGGAPSLFDLLNRTRSTGGRDALLRRFRRPLPTAADIRAVQEALRFIQDHRYAFVFLPDDNTIKPVRAYLGANFTTIGSTTGPRATLESFWLKARYRDIYREMKAGLSATATLLGSVRAFLDGLPDSELPALLTEHVDAMRAQISTPPLATFAQIAGLSALELCQHDRTLRSTERASVIALIDALAQVDALIALADITIEKGFSFPEIDDGASGMSIEGAFHPFLTQPVANDLTLSSEQRVLFLTGPNMAGKTTYLKTCGIVVYLAHLGMGVPATRASLAPFGCLFSGIHTTDNLREGTSYFLAEARRVKQIASLLQHGTRTFGLFDEIFKGTNVKDAGDACRSVIDGLTHAQGSVFLVSSHLLELVPDLEPNPRITFGCFDADVATRDLRYDYRLKPGHSAQRLGMRVLEQEGVLEMMARIPTESVTPNPESPIPG